MSEPVAESAKSVSESVAESASKSAAEQRPYVIIKHAPKLDYTHDYVALPASYGTPDYYKRADVQAILNTVFSALDDLHKRTGIGDQIREHEYVIVKPNLVNVFHHSGYYDKNGQADFPETTDPRVFDAVVSWIGRWNTNIVIAESSGKPFPTSASFKITGYDKIARAYHAGLVCLEREPVVRYVLPQAEVMKEILIPQLFEDVVLGKAFYVSVPKMKTNIYTGVTLSFKNAMGTIPYYLRERNHTHAINKKLADMLFLFQPSMVLIDGIIGGEGNTPAPVDPVEVGIVVASNHSVEADRITTHMMGFNPSDIKLMREVDARGFGNDQVVIEGEVTVTPFRPATPSLMRGAIAESYPGIIALAGHTLPGAPEVSDPNAVTPDIAYALEQACVGGCLSSVAMGLAAAQYGPRSERHYTASFIVLEGEGIVIGSSRYWFDKDGNPWTAEDIQASGMKVMAMGKCAGARAHAMATYSIKGCCDPAECLNATSNALGIVTDQLNPVRNRSLVLRAVPGLMGTMAARTRWILRGRDVDVPRAHEDRVFDVPDVAELVAAAQETGEAYCCTVDPDTLGELETIEDVINFVAWPLPELTSDEKRARIKDMGNLFGSLTGMFGMLKHYRP